MPLVARAGGTTMKIISRSGWGARAPRSHQTVSWGRRTEFIVHYSEGPTSQTVRSIQNFHLDGRGWSDIGYNFLVDVQGRIYEGRGWLVVGAHAPDHNSSGIGVCMIGRDGDSTPAAKRAIRWLYDEACRRKGGTLRKLGHRDVYSTSCPGDELYAWVRAGMPATGIEEDDMPSPKDLWEWDGVPAPKNASTYKKNPTWKPGSHLADINERVRELQSAVAGLASKVGADVDADAVAEAVLARLTPERIAAAIPDELAEQVVDALAARLSKS